jgi:hypothetical protein
MIFEFTKALKFHTRRFRRNFDVGFFLNSSRILKDFRKEQYSMPCNASYARLFLERFLYARQIWYATYMHFYVGKILFLQKTGVTLFTTISLADVMGAQSRLDRSFSLTPIFTVTISSAEICGHLPCLTPASSFRFLFLLCYCFHHVRFCSCMVHIKFTIGPMTPVVSSEPEWMASDEVPEISAQQLEASME